LRMIALRDVTKTYRIGDASLAAISGVDLEIPKGEFVAVMGPSGSGKSTLLFTIGGLLAPTSGDVQVGSKSIYKLTRKERARFIRANMGFVFQSFELLPYLTALENVAVALYLSDVHHSKHQAMANEALERVGLRGRASHRPSQLSGGEQQRVAVARAIVKNPAILLADEPTGNLDQKTGDGVIRFLLELCRNERLTTVLVTHDQSKARLADRMFLMTDGRLKGGDVDE